MGKRRRLQPCCLLHCRNLEELHLHHLELEIMQRLLGNIVHLSVSSSWSQNSCETAKKNRKYSSTVHCASAPNSLLHDVLI